MNFFYVRLDGQLIEILINPSHSQLLEMKRNTPNRDRKVIYARRCWDTEGNQYVWDPNCLHYRIIPLIVYKKCVDIDFKRKEDDGYLYF